MNSFCWTLSVAVQFAAQSRLKGALLVSIGRQSEQTSSSLSNDVDVAACGAGIRLFQALQELFWPDGDWSDC